MTTETELYTQLTHALIRLCVLTVIVFGFVFRVLKDEYELKIPVKRFTVMYCMLLLPFAAMFFNTYIFIFFIIGFCLGVKEVLVDVKYRIKLFSWRGAFTSYRFTSLLLINFFVTIYITAAGDVNSLLGVGLFLYSLLSIVITSTQDAVTRH